ncbi:hypothetical protein F2P81_004159 [Scophthalmus maximus]|uniref:Uncharacterized protein n=1 Tax=Scophthalmus maximus TaxID=52904 RepID=A0A6A4TLE8_SCOMX|nr:hypothetical protein F2P81_004159 [Scophthalmus maximus]
MNTSSVISRRHRSSSKCGENELNLVNVAKLLLHNQFSNKVLLDLNRFRVRTESFLNSICMLTGVRRNLHSGTFWFGGYLRDSCRPPSAKTPTGAQKGWEGQFKAEKVLQHTPSTCGPIGFTAVAIDSNNVTAKSKQLSQKRTPAETENHSLLQSPIISNPRGTRIPTGWPTKRPCRYHTSAVPWPTFMSPKKIKRRQYIRYTGDVIDRLQ